MNNSLPPRPPAGWPTAFSRLFTIHYQYVWLVGLFSLLSMTWVQAQTGAQPAFNCQPGKSYYIAFVSGSSALYSVNLITGASVQVKAALIPGADLQNLGYNPTDNYLWAVQNNTDKLVRIGSDGSAQTVAIPGLPLSSGSQLFAAGDFNSNGIFYMYQTFSGNRLLTPIDLNPSSPTYLTKLSSITLTSAPSTYDLSTNPIDGNLYGVDASSRVIRINPTTGQVTDLGPSGATTGGSFGPGYGATYFDNQGTLYFIENNTGSIYKIPNVASGNTASSYLAAAQRSQSLDGARCPNSPVETTALSGTVFNDTNGLTDNTVNGTPVSSLKNNTFYVSVVNSTGTVVASNSLTSGTYSFTGIGANTSYTLVLSNTPGTVGAAPPSTTLTGGVVNTGETLGTGPGSDGTPNGVFSLTVGTGSVDNVNFGVKAVPDLTPQIFILPTVAYGATPTTVVVNVVELLGTATSGLITVLITKDPLLSLSFDPTATMIGGKPVSNSSWTFNANPPGRPAYYALTTTSVVAAGNVLSFGLSGTLTPGATKGTLPISTVILAGSGGEVNFTNNVDSEKVDYFITR